MTVTACRAALAIFPGRAGLAALAVPAVLAGRVVLADVTSVDLAQAYVPNRVKPTTITARKPSVRNLAPMASAHR